MIVGLLLAAGAARRFGAPKLVQPLHGKPVARWSAEALVAATDRLLVVVPPDDAALRAALRGVPARFVVNGEPESGVGRSIARGMAALPGDADAVVIALADEPALESGWVDAVVSRYRHTPGVAIVAARFRGTRRHPVLFDRRVFSELASLDGDRGARDVVDRDPGRVEYVDYDAAGTIDVDTPEDLARLEQAAQFTAPQRPSAS